MIGMDQYEYIRTAKREYKKSIKEICRDTGHSRNPENTLCIPIVANIAKTAILGMEACFPDSVVGFVADERLCKVKYIHFYIKTVKDKLEYYASATAQKNINLETLYGVMVPLPPVAEQEKIIEEIERYYSLADAAETAIDQSFKQSERLRQSILKKAFSGQLGPQDPEDEPAEALLARIREEKSKRTPTVRKGQRGRKPRELF
jgi:type I restriction enzyme, S subunit